MGECAYRCMHIYVHKHKCVSVAVGAIFRVALLPWGSSQVRQQVGVYAGHLKLQPTVIMGNGG